jgi:hypothetical protein
LILNMQFIAFLQLNTCQVCVLLFSLVFKMCKHIQSIQKEVCKYDIKPKLGSAIYRVNSSYVKISPSMKLPNTEPVLLLSR